MQTGEEPVKVSSGPSHTRCSGARTTASKTTRT